MSLNDIMSLNQMILCSKLKNSLCKTVTKSQLVTKSNVTKSRLHCIACLIVNLPQLMFPVLLMWNINFTLHSVKVKEKNNNVPLCCSLLNLVVTFSNFANYNTTLKIYSCRKMGARIIS